MKKKYLKVILICTLGILLSNCEDGEIGTAGENGINGTNGINGENGAGFDELVKYGSIKLTLAGTKPDNVTFTETSEFKYAPVFANHNTFLKKNSNIYFNFSRFLSSPDDVFQGSKLYFFLEVKNMEGQDQTLDFLGFDINEYAIISNNLTFHEINQTFKISLPFDNNRTDIKNFNLTNYSFNDQTNNLIFSFSFIVSGDQNSTKNDLSVSGEVNVVILENINPKRG